MTSVISLSAIRTEFKLSLRLILPLMASELIYALNGFLATIMIAHL